MTLASPEEYPAAYRGIDVAHLIDLRHAREIADAVDRECRTQDDDRPKHGDYKDEWKVCRAIARCRKDDDARREYLRERDLFKYEVYVGEDKPTEKLIQMARRERWEGAGDIAMQLAVSHKIAKEICFALDRCGVPGLKGKRYANKAEHAYGPQLV